MSWGQHSVSWIQGVSSVLSSVSWGTYHVVEVCRGQHAILRGVVGTGLPCRGLQGVVEGCRGQRGGVSWGTGTIPVLGESTCN